MLTSSPGGRELDELVDDIDELGDELDWVTPSST